jgi:thioredoxin reductase (NADPH)
MAGLDLLRKGRRLHPELRTLLCAHDLAIAADALNTATLDHFLIKPFDGERDLLPIASDLLDGWEGARERDAAGVRVVGERDSSRADEIRRFLDRNQIHYQWLTPSSGDGRALLERVPDQDRASLPVAVFQGGLAIADPTNLELASQLGIPTCPLLTLRPGDRRGRTGRVGGGRTDRRGPEHGRFRAEAPGGQAGQSPRIDNYLGFTPG